MSILFFANLGDENASDLAIALGEREAVLISTPTTSRRPQETARTIQARQIPLAADNGNTAVIFRLAREFVDRAVALADARAPRSARPAAQRGGVERADHTQADLPVERGLDAATLFRQRLAESRARPATENDRRLSASTAAATPSPAALRAGFRSLARDVAARCAAFVDLETQARVLASQVAVGPSFLTCLEDLTVPVLTQLEVDRRDTGLARAFFVGLQARGLDMAARVVRGGAGRVHGVPYATVHAIDYESGLEVGRRAAAIPELEGLATGLASFLNDRRYTTGYTVRGRRVWVRGRRSVPRRYLATLLVTRGLLDGFAEQRGALPRFHGLGAGSPMIVLLLALAGHGSPLLSLDSTAPEKNASMGKVFVTRPAPLTIDLTRTAQALVDGRAAWDCPCPHCAHLQRDLPFDLAAARAFYAARIAPRPIENRDLESEDGIGRHLSLCWNTRAKPAARSIAHARVNHNHWAIHELLAQLRLHGSSYQDLRRFVGEQCEAYKTTANATFAVQIDECLRLLDRLGPASVGR